MRQNLGKHSIELEQHFWGIYTSALCRCFKSIPSDKRRVGIWQYVEHMRCSLGNVGNAQKFGLHRAGAYATAVNVKGLELLVQALCKAHNICLCR